MTDTLESPSVASISRLTVPEVDTLPQALQDQIASLERQLGYVPNWIRAFALGGAHTARFNTYLLALLDPNSGVLPYVDREILATVSSAENGCSYCRLNHAGSLGDAIGDNKIGTRVAVDYREVRELSARHRTLADFAAKLSAEPGEVDDADIDTLRALGLNDEEIFEAVHVVSAFAAANRFSIFLQVTPDDQFFN
ncbi:peroxidase-related enzyme [Gordonia sp. OPL2]|uniref:peroxidase-related enzyme n=1 Tax=Gordonia sp. OPL2 TaxID=2486274 RepID=UPI001654EB57|nr:peroxidase-related enzyme [Gordonia sp. OPL2]RPA12346.1 peroxidase [Gordonia sp. OPL2]